MHVDSDAAVATLRATTFCGRRFSRQQILQIIETVETFRHLSRRELALTICENFNWTTPTSGLKVNSALELLEKFERLGLCSPPPLRAKAANRSKRILAPVANVIVPVAVNEPLDEICPIRLSLASQENNKHFNELMQNHHYLGYKRPFGAHLRYFVHDKNGRELGLILFASSAWSLEARDAWIGWERRHRLKRLHLVISNTRFLIFPWINVPNLASKILSMVTARVADDWQTQYGYRPVLIETFVDREKYMGTCYQAANWLNLGQTKGRGRSDKHCTSPLSVKDIYALPLAKNFRDVLLRGEKQSAEPNACTNEDVRDRLCRIHDSVLKFWSHVAPLIKKIAERFDQQWQKRRRTIDSMLLVLLIFKLVTSRAKQGYGSTIDEVWENCRNQGLPLPQKSPIAASAFAVARRKLHEDIFKTINNRVIEEYSEFFIDDAWNFHGHRLYAVDGCKINLPHTLLKDGFQLPDKNAHYPQGLLSCLYRLRTRVPFDFELTSDTNERHAALRHLQILDQGDVVIYDRGYFSYEMLHAHLEQGVHAIFRLNESSFKPITDFFASDEPEHEVEIKPTGKKNIAKLRKSIPEIVIKPLRLRLIKYRIGDQVYCLGTTLTDKSYLRSEFKDLYHGRWSIEELYKISKQVAAIEEFHGKTLRTVRQEVYAHMSLITLNRILTNHTDDLHKKSTDNASAAPPNTNFKNAIMAVTRNLESLVISSTQNMARTLLNILDSLSRRYHTPRPGRSYPRRSLKPRPKWGRKGRHGETPKQRAA